MSSIISFFQNARDPFPEEREVEWPPFEGHIRTHEKTNTEAFSPALFMEECPKCDPNAPNEKCKLCRGTIFDVRRNLETVESVAFAVIDLDHLDEEKFLSTLALFEGLSMAVYSSWSHLTPYTNEQTGIELAGSDNWCARLILQLTRPVTAREWPTFWRGLAELSGWTLDKSVKDSSRIYFVPSAHVDSEVEPIFEVFEGEPIDVDDLLRSAPSPLSNSPKEKKKKSKGTVTSEDLETLANVLNRKTSSTTKKAAKAIKSALRGEAYSNEGSRDNTLLYVAGELSKAFPEEDPDHLASFFERSIETVIYRDGDGPDLDNFINKIERKQAEVEEEREKNEIFVEERRADQRFRAFKAIGVERETVYNDDDLLDMDVAPDEWIIQKGDLYYFRVLDRYSRGYTPNEASVQAEILLSPARHIKTQRMNQQGELISVPLKDLVKEHGQVIDRISYDITSDISYLEDGTLYEAPCPILLEPEYNSGVQQWLEELGGDNNFEKLLEWVGYVSCVEYPLTALYLSGKKNSGKSLLANGLSRLWSTGGPTPMQTILNSFNASIIRCPLIFGDEKLPRDMSTEHLRSLVQDRSTQINAKYKEEVPMRGSLRYILAANNRKLLRPSDDMTANDVEAFAERFFYLPINKASMKVLDRMGHSEIQRKWINEGGIAKHSLWLKTQLPDPSGISDRFLVTGGERGLVDHLMVHSGARSAICQWMLSYLKDPKRLRTLGKIGVFDGEFHVDVETIYNNWDVYHRRERCPGISRLSSLLEGIATALKTDEGEHYHCVDINLLSLWADTTNVATPTRVQSLLREAEKNARARRSGKN